MPTLKGNKLALKLPPETQNGKIFRLARQGMPRLNDTSRGDMLARVAVVLPTNLNAKERALFEQFQKMRPS